MRIEAPAYLPGMTESQFQNLVKEAATLNGWLYYHTKDSRRSERGFPDTVLARGDDLYFWELKTGRRVATPEQMVWVEAIRKARFVTADIFYPAHWDLMALILDKGSNWDMPD